MTPLLGKCRRNNLYWLCASLLYCGEQVIHGLRIKCLLLTNVREWWVLYILCSGGKTWLESLLNVKHRRHDYDKFLFSVWRIENWFFPPNQVTFLEDLKRKMKTEDILWVQQAISINDLPKLKYIVAQTVLRSFYSQDMHEVKGASLSFQIPQTPSRKSS